MKEIINSLNPLSIFSIGFVFVIFVLVLSFYAKSNHIPAKLLQIVKNYLPGHLLQISLTFKCSLDCSYCSQKFKEGHRPRVKEANFIGWVKFFRRYPYKIREVYVSGGEPTLHPDFERIVLFLMDQGYFVTIFTNLTNYEKIVNLPRCRRLCIAATYHHSYDINKFDYGYRRVNLKHYIYVKENETQKLDYSKQYPLLTKETAGMDLYEIRCLRVSPDLRINLNCYELISE